MTRELLSGGIGKKKYVPESAAIFVSEGVKQHALVLGHAAPFLVPTGFLPLTADGTRSSFLRIVAPVATVTFLPPPLPIAHRPVAADEHNLLVLGIQATAAVAVIGLQVGVPVPRHLALHQILPDRLLEGAHPGAHGRGFLGALAQLPRHATGDGVVSESARASLLAAGEGGISSLDLGAHAQLPSGC